MRRNNRALRKRQRGVALITVLLVFALVAVIATEMLRRSQLSLRSVGNLVETRQAYYYALGGEAYARQLLAKDLMEHGDVDTLAESWAQTKDQQPFEIDNGNMQIEINDLQGRFNLNSVAENSGFNQFVRLLQALQLNPKYASEWRNWISNKSTSAANSGNGSTNNGSDDDTGQSVYTAGHAEADITALRLLPSMQPEDYAKLAPHVTVLPADVTMINVNTADTAVLRSISSTLSESQAAQIITRQQSGGYHDNVEVPGLNGAAASLSSSFFEVVVTVNYANRWQRVRTVLQRKRDSSNKVEITVLSRLRSPLIDDLEF